MINMGITSLIENAIEECCMLHIRFSSLYMTPNISLKKSGRTRSDTGHWVLDVRGIG